MRYLLAGPDDYSLKQKLSEIKLSLGDTALLADATTLFEGARVKAAEFKLTVDALPFLTPCRLVIVTGLLSRFQPAGGQVNKASRLEEADTFSAAVRAAPPTTAIILIEPELNRRNPLFAGLADILEVHEFPVLDRSGLKAWIGSRVSLCGGAIAPGAINLLAQYVGADLWALSGEIEKLRLFAGSRPITEADVKTLVGYTGEASIFNLVDAVIECRLKPAVESLEALKAGGLPAGYALSMMSRQLRLIILYLDLKSRGEKEIEIRRRLGLTADFVWRKTAAQAARFSFSRAAVAYRRLLETDLAIKTGRMEESAAVDLLVAELASGAGLETRELS
ncbi:DNA polymerase III, delta subunit [Dehalogenimonas alkenigignens]|uniref:DNA-directed DNA polymerase n=1 Tax=Dehalogenimonas alkenigignens TaxID=1217799 RepID=A0A0W0GGS3_9CHLR|nr:DNA polymerase III subunit delta [Dehalogenimonas alkenigignens]KTB47739.1 DNA polymerase III, delta subunit [Dehalogenimonas alkenigignens]